MRLSKQTSDAIRLLVLCTQSEGELLKVAGLVEQIGVTKPLGLKIVNMLARLGYLETVRGPKGGVRLSCDPAKTTLGQVVHDLEALEMTGGRASEDNRVNAGLAGFVDDAFSAFLSVLDGHTLSDLAAGGRVQAGDGADARPGEPADTRKPGRRGGTATRREARA